MNRRPSILPLLSKRLVRRLGTPGSFLAGAPVLPGFAAPVINSRTRRSTKSSLLRPVPLVLLSLCFGTWQAIPATAPVTTLSSNAAPPTVGMEGRIEVLLPPGLRASVATNQTALLLRIASTRPHGGQVHYDLRYIGRVAGEHDLRRYLIDTNNSPATNLPLLAVQVAGILPKTHNGWLEDQALRAPSMFGGYRAVVATVIVVWALLLFPLVLLRRRAVLTTDPGPVRLPSLADRLKPLVEAAAAGTLAADGQAALERMLINHWQRRLQLESLSGELLIQRLREHPEAGLLLDALEDWLHRPPGSVAVRIDELLAPYRQLPVESGEVAR